MIQNLCNQLPSNSQKILPNLTKDYTEPYIQAESLKKTEQTPLKDSSQQNKMNKTAKTIRLKCFAKAAHEIENKADVREIKENNKTQCSQDKIEKTFNKKQSQIFGNLKKNVLKSVIYKSNRFIDKNSCSRENSNFSRTNLMPKSRETSVQSIQQKKNPNSKSLSKELGNQTSKSKKKIEFTIYQSRKKSANKIDDLDELNLNDRSDLFRHIESVYSLPHPCTANIVIDLSGKKSTKKLNASSVSSRSKSISREKSKQNQRNDSFHKNLQKDPVSIKNQLKISETLQKLKKFKIVKDYANKGEIENLLKGFILAGEPECKWVLLVIDGVFKKIRNPISNDKL